MFHNRVRVAPRAVPGERTSQRPPAFQIETPRCSDDGLSDTDTLALDLLCEDDITKTIVVGIDFGTTYSGVSWAVDAGRRPVRLIEDWPNPASNINNANSEKVPSLISYGTGDSRGEVAWGFEAKDSVLRQFKIQLDPDHDHALKLRDMSAIGLTDDDIRTAEKATTDYLRELWKYAHDTIRAQKADDEDNKYVLRAVLTVPAMWSQEAKDKTRSLALAAGVPGPIEIVSEPEAAAIAAFRVLAEEGTTFKAGDIFVVCDAGGGTADLISYEITNPRPLEVEECVRGTGDICGAGFIDEAFENMIRSKVGKGYFEIKSRYREKMIRDFGVNIKRSFDYEPGINKKFTVELRGVADNPDEGIRQERIPFDSNALRTIFDGVCDKVVALVEKQVLEVEKQKKEVKTVLLVGGFGSNKYLGYRIKSAMRSRLKPVNVSQIADSWSSVCRGATIWGLQHLNRPKAKTSSSDSEVGNSMTTATVKSRFPPASFGIRLDTGEMVWLVEAGESYANNSRSTKTIKREVGKIGFLDRLFNTRKTLTHTLWSCHTGRSVPPTHFNAGKMRKFCELSHQMRNGKLYRVRGGKLEFQIAVQLGSASLKFFVMSTEGKFSAECEKEYPGRWYSKH
ncbi:hypothetical protein B0I37DRAFT_375808 [Chaetomium sp. MPI-CAGE-AT-0009]|nr:hypothetical protein B0I37DRAFT_375808 [Chaetomium sp. MPI-CAGE-AT-0009]